MSLRFLNTLLRQRRLITEFLSLAIACAALAGSFLLRFEFAVPPAALPLLGRALLLSMALKFFVFRAFSLRHVGWRHVGFADLLRICSAHLSASLLLALVVRTTLGESFPRSVYILDPLLCVALEIGTRGAIRILFSSQELSRSNPRRVLIYGAGKAGVLLLDELRRDPSVRYDVAAFLDDDPSKRDMRIHGVRVVGGRGELRRTAAKLSIDEILLALPQASGDQLAAILEQCQEAHLPAKRVPALTELIDGRILDQVREVRIEDLLGRPPATLGSREVERRLQGQVVLVTGAGGSIGSELCRQIARHGPSLLIGFDQSETALYDVENQLRASFPRIPFSPQVGSIQNLPRIEEVFAEFRPQLVFHAAAYKHVPMMEAHMFEAVQNNVFGTMNVVRTARRWGTQDFVMISSDKAVRPTNIMGATKRICELVCMAEAGATGADGAMNVVAVRFGNVLGSNGSVIPRFRQQIEEGGPVTVTHPNVERFFMTIPEAAQLVLQAASMGSRGAIFVLEMGKPVRILDLARKMVQLSGLRPGADIEIRFCGLRPGEKMFEELTGYQENTAPTPHPQIRVFSGALPDRRALERQLEHLSREAEIRNSERVLEIIQQLVPDYTPSPWVTGGTARQQARSVVA